MKQLFSKKRERVIFIIAVNLAVMLACAFLLVPQIDISGDDMVLHTYTSKAYGESTRYSGYTGIVLGELIYQLQNAVPQYNWLIIIEYLLIFAAFCALSVVVVCRCENLVGTAFGCALAVLFAPQFYNWIQYTKTAMLFTVAGFILVFFALSETCIKRGLVVAGGLLAFMGAQLRMTSFFAGCTFAFVIGIYSITDFSGVTSVKTWFKKYKRYLIIFPAIFAFVFGMDLAKTVVYNRDGDAAEFWEYCETRATLSDYAIPSYASHAAEYRELGITPNDIEMIERWSFGDLEYFTTEKLQAIIDMREPQSLSTTIELFASEAPNVLINKPMFWAAAVLFALCIAFCKKRERLLAIGLFVCFAACFFYQFHIGRTTRWVQDGFIGCFAASLLYCLLGSNFRFEKKMWTAAGALITLAALMFSFISYRGERSDYNTYFDVSRNEFYEILNADEDSLYLAHISALPSPIVPTFSSMPDDIFKNIYVLGGWDTGGAHKNSVLERFGIEGSPYRALLEKDNVYLIDKHRYELKATFIREHFDADARYVLFDVSEKGGFYIFAFSTNFPEESCIEAEDIAISSAYAKRYEENYSFSTITVNVDGHLDSDVTYYFEVTMPHGMRATYRATMKKDGQLKAIVPEVDFYLSGDYELRVIAAEETGNIISAQSAAIEF